MSKTEDRLEGTPAGVQTVGNGRRATGTADTQEAETRTAHGCRWLPTSPWGSRAATPRPRPPSTPTAPSRGSSGRHPSSWRTSCSGSARCIFSFLGLIIQVWIPKILQNGITNSLILKTQPLHNYVKLIAVLALFTGVFGYISRTNLFKVAYAIEFDLRNILYEHFTRMSFPFYDRVQSGQLISRANSDIRSVQMYLTFAAMILVQCSIARGRLRLHAVHQRAPGLRRHGVHAVHLHRRHQNAEVALPGVVAHPVPPGRGGHRRGRERQRRACRAQLRRRAAAAGPAGQCGRPGPVGLHQGRRPARPLRPAGAEPLPGRPRPRPARRRLVRHPRPPAGRLHRLVQPLPGDDAGPVHDARDADHDGPARLGLGRADLRDHRREAHDHRPPRRHRLGRLQGRRRVRRRELRLRRRQPALQGERRDEGRARSSTT